MNPNDLREKRKQRLARLKEITETAGKENRELTPEETAKFDEIRAEISKIDESLKRLLDLTSLNAPADDDVTDESASDRSAEIGVDDRDIRKYSILRAIRAQLPGGGGWRAAKLEKDLSDAVAQRLGKQPNGFYVPYDILRTNRRRRGGEVRDMTIGTAGNGGYLKATDLDAASFIELLTNRMILGAAGITTLSGLVGDVDIPRQATGATAYWLAESGAPSESTPTVEKITLQPKTAGAYLDMSRKFIQQTSIDADAFAEMDLARCLALALDAAGLHGTGADDQPTSIAATSGIGDVAGGTNGAAPTYAHIVELETDVAVANADLGNLAYVTNTKVRGKLKTTARVASTDSQMVWQDGDTPLNGYKALVSNQVSSTLTKGTAEDVCSAIFFGNWSELIMGLWGGLDLLVDPYTASTTGVVRVVAFQDVDFKVRHAASFAAMLDALTT